jgi:hypothetical protein
MKGQAFSTFKILIGSVFAVVMLAIVYFAVSTYAPPISGMDLMGDLVKQATNAPENCFSRQNAEFNSGETIEANSFLPLIIKEFHSSNPGVIDCGSSSCDINENIKIAVSSICHVNEADIECDVYLGSNSC